MLAVALLVLQHVAVVDVIDGVVLQERAIEIDAGKIRAISPARSYRPPDGATIVDLPGRYVGTWLRRRARSCAVSTVRP
jgi:imidazolonepropionase-like amidohydrolase